MCEIADIFWNINICNNFDFFYVLIQGVTEYEFRRQKLKKNMLSNGNDS